MGGAGSRGTRRRRRRSARAGFNDSEIGRALVLVLAVLAVGGGDGGRRWGVVECGAAGVRDGVVAVQDQSLVREPGLSLVEVSEEPTYVDEVMLPWDHIRLSAMSCQEGPTYSRFTPANMDFITPAEQCSVCEQVVSNMNHWNWQKHYSSLCVKVPRHLVDLCKHYACKMAIQCPEFISNKCVVDGYERFPCPAKYLCWNCLGIPKQQIAGCFDGTAAGIAGS